MWAARLRRVAGVVVFLVSVVAVGWGIWPHRPEVRSLTLPEGELFGTNADAGAAWSLRLEWPGVVLKGDPAIARLELLPIAGVQPTPPAASPEPAGIWMAARLELPGVEVSPLGEITQAIVPGRPLRFVWRLRPGHVGHTGGTVWLHRRTQPEPGAAGTLTVVTAQKVDLRAASFLGFSGPWARALGCAGMVMGAVAVFDVFAVCLRRDNPDGK